MRKFSFRDLCCRSHDLSQPYSQGLSPPTPQSERRETLVGSGHIPPRQLRTIGRGPLMSRNWSRFPLSNSKQGYRMHWDHHNITHTLKSSPRAARSVYSNVNLNIKPVICLEANYHGQDIVAVYW